MVIRVSPAGDVLYSARDILYTKCHHVLSRQRWCTNSRVKVFHRAHGENEKERQRALCGRHKAHKMLGVKCKQTLIQTAGRCDLINARAL